jgi:hypothetical protein
VASQGLHFEYRVSMDRDGSTMILMMVAGDGIVSIYLLQFKLILECYKAIKHFIYKGGRGTIILELEQ